MEKTNTKEPDYIMLGLALVSTLCTVALVLKDFGVFNRKKESTSNKKKNSNL